MKERTPPPDISTLTTPSETQLTDNETVNWISNIENKVRAILQRTDAHITGTSVQDAEVKINDLLSGAEAVIEQEPDSQTQKMCTTAILVIRRDVEKSLWLFKSALKKRRKI